MMRPWQLALDRPTVWGSYLPVHRKNCIVNFVVNYPPEAEVDADLRASSPFSP